MAKVLDIYKCAHCGNIVELYVAGAGELVCCGEPMRHMVEGEGDGAKEKHVPVIEKTADGFKVTVGSIPHPMEEAHFIEWIELITQDGVAYTQFLKPGQKPEAFFPVKASHVTAREYCNLHGHFKAEQ